MISLSRPKADTQEMDPDANVLQEWQRIQEFVPPVRGSRDDFTKAWASEAQVSEKQLARIEAEGPLAAHLLLASVERLLHQVCFRYTSGVRFPWPIY